MTAITTAQSWKLAAGTNKRTWEKGNIIKSAIFAYDFVHIEGSVFEYCTWYSKNNVMHASRITLLEAKFLLAYFVSSCWKQNRSDMASTDLALIQSNL